MMNDRDRTAATDCLSVAYEIWIIAQGLKLESAEELLAKPFLTGEQRTWLYLFDQLWEATKLT